MRVAFKNPGLCVCFAKGDVRQPKNGFILLINFNEVVHIESTGFKCLLKNLEIGVFKHVGSRNRHTL